MITVQDAKATKKWKTLEHKGIMFADACLAGRFDRNALLGVVVDLQGFLLSMALVCTELGSVADGNTHLPARSARRSPRALTFHGFGCSVASRASSGCGAPQHRQQAARYEPHGIPIRYDGREIQLILSTPRITKNTLLLYTTNC